MIISSCMLIILWSVVHLLPQVSCPAVSRVQLKYTTMLKRGPFDSHYCFMNEVICDDILPLLKCAGHTGDMGLFYTLHGIFCHSCYICHCNIIFILYGSMDDKIFASPLFSFSGTYILCDCRWCVSAT